jgi:hypothetical protein
MMMSILVILNEWTMNEHNRICIQMKGIILYRYEWRILWMDIKTSIHKSYNFLAMKRAQGFKLANEVEGGRTLNYCTIKSAYSV